jgi:hypothetical protein
MCIYIYIKSSRSSLDILDTSEISYPKDLSDISYAKAICILFENENEKKNENENEKNYLNFKNQLNSRVNKTVTCVEDEATRGIYVCIYIYICIYIFIFIFMYTLNYTFIHTYYPCI